MRNKDCEFCNLLQKERVFHIDEEIVAFMAKDAIGPGQSIVIPRKHIKDLRELPYSTICKMFNLCKLILTVLMENFKADGVNIICNNGKFAGQTVSHFHVHIVPRFKNDVNNPKLWLNDRLYKKLHQPKLEDLEKMAEKMKLHLNLLYGESNGERR